MTREELIAALEKAEGPNGELDTAIGVFTRVPGTRLDQAEFDRMCQSFTGSIDAALTLLPRETWWTLQWCAGKASVILGDGLNLIEEDGPTPAIALCIAALKARGETQ